MTRQTLVVVYAVDDAGATGRLLGAAALIDPTFALVYPPLNEELADGPEGLRVAVFAAAEGIAEAIDVVQVWVVPDAQDLVLLQLAAASRAPVDAPAQASAKAELVAALRRMLAEGPPPLDGLPPVGAPQPVSRWEPHFPHGIGGDLVKTLEAVLGRGGRRH